MSEARHVQTPKDSFTLIQPRVQLSERMRRQLDGSADALMKSVSLSFYQVRDKDDWLPSDKKYCLVQNRPMLGLREDAVDFHSVHCFKAADGAEFRLGIGLFLGAGTPDGPRSWRQMTAGPMERLQLKALPCGNELIQLLADGNPAGLYLKGIVESHTIIQSLRQHLFSSMRGDAVTYWIPQATRFYASIHSAQTEAALVRGEDLIFLSMRNAGKGAVTLSLSVSPHMVVPWSKLDSSALVAGKSGILLLGADRDIVNVPPSAISVPELMEKYPAVRRRFLMSLLPDVNLIDSPVTLAELEGLAASIIDDPSAKAYVHTVAAEDAQFTYYSIETGSAVYGTMVPVILADDDEKNVIAKRAWRKEGPARAFLDGLLKMKTDGVILIDEHQLSIKKLPFQRRADPTPGWAVAKRKMHDERMRGKASAPVPALSMAAMSPDSRFVHLSKPTRDKSGSGDAGLDASYGDAEWLLQKALAVYQGIPQQGTFSKKPKPDMQASLLNLQWKKELGLQLTREYIARQSGADENKLIQPLLPISGSDTGLSLGSRISIVMPISEGPRDHGYYVLSSLVSSHFFDFGLDLEIIDSVDGKPEEAARRLRDLLMSYSPAAPKDRQIVLFMGAERTGDRWLFSRSIDGLSQMDAAYVEMRDEDFFEMSGKDLRWDKSEYATFHAGKQLGMILYSKSPAVLGSDFKRSWLRPLMLTEATPGSLSRLEECLIMFHQISGVLHTNYLEMSEIALLRLCKNLRRFVTGLLRISYSEEAAAKLALLIL